MTILALDELDINFHTSHTWYTNVPIRFISVFVQLKPGNFRSLSVEDRAVNSTLLSGGKFDRFLVTANGNNVRLGQII